MEIALYLVVAGLLVVGLVGSVVPVIPGAALILLGAVLYAAGTGFETIGPGRLLILGGLAGLAYALDYLAAALGARRFGGSGLAIAGALLGALVGVFFGLVGLILGPVIGAVAGEAIRSRRLDASVKSGIGTVVGMVLGTLAKFCLALIMVALFLWWVAAG
jgi:uncharacterized protein YqgC (DUF456 family)